MIRKRVMESFTGPTAENITVVGKMVNNMASELTPLLVVRQSKENGQKVKDFTGSQMTNNEIKSLNRFYQ